MVMVSPSVTATTRPMSGAGEADLADYGCNVGIHRIKRIRKELGLRCRQKKKFKATTDSNHSLPVAPNLLNRQFSVTAPNKAWVTDISVPQQAA